MSEWERTKDSWRGLKASLARADLDAKYDFTFWLSGLAMMAASIVLQFGWLGALFCGGLVIWWASNANLRS